MALQQVEELVNKLEKNMIRDWIISSDIQSIKIGRLNWRRRLGTLMITATNFMMLLRFVIGFGTDSKSDLHFLILNPLYGFGYIGRFIHGIFVCGYLGIIAHALVFYANEGRGSLNIVTDIKELYSKLKDPTEEEQASFMKFLKLSVYIREMMFVIAFLPLGLIRSLAAVVTAYTFNSMWFSVGYLPVFIIYLWTGKYCYQLWAYVHIIIAQSTTYLRLRLRRVERSLKNVVSKSMSEKNTRKLQLKIINSINDVLYDFTDILNEVLEHNKCIKHFLRDELILMAGVCVMFVVFLLGEIEWYFRLAAIIVFPVVPLGLAISFNGAAEIYITTRSLAKILHSCQLICQIEGSQQTRYRAQSVPGIRDFPRYTDIVKTKYQIMRMIQRVSSPHLRVGFTEGDGKSFSPASAAEFVDSVVITTLMFLNSNRSSVVGLMK